MRNYNTPALTLWIAFLLCFICSIVVASAAVLLKPVQDFNKDLDKKQNVIRAAGLSQKPNLDAEEIEEIFATIEIKTIDLSSGTFINPPKDYNPVKAQEDPKFSRELSGEEDIAGIQRQPTLMQIYLVNNDEGELDKIVLPIYGYGLWSTLYGFLALEADANKVAGIGFYQHGETPGLGGEVDNPKWKAQWEGKQLYSKKNEVSIRLVKGGVDPSSADAQYKVDALSGATITSRGVEQLVHFWMGEQGYKPFLNNLTKDRA